MNDTKKKTPRVAKPVSKAKPKAKPVATWSKPDISKIAAKPKKTYLRNVSGMPQTVIYNGQSIEIISRGFELNTSEGLLNSRHCKDLMRAGALILETV